MEILKIIILCVMAAVIYGILHDQVTARVCVEYFTIGHPPVFATRSPTLLGLGWGVIATWWMGLGIGIMLAIAGRAGGRPRMASADLLKPVAVLLVVMGVMAAVSGVAGYVAARSGTIRLMGDLAERVPRAKHDAFLADLWAHNASYAGGAGGGVVLAIMIWRRRGRMAGAATSSVVR